MLTVEQLRRQLEHLPNDLPVGAIVIDRVAGSQRLRIAVRDVVEVDIVHDRLCGEPRSVWLTCHAADGPRTVPVAVVSKETCGCSVSLDATRDGSVNLDAIPCAHHIPDDIVSRSARR